MSSYNLQIGQLGENIAVRYLQENGYSIIKRHFTAHWGEIDIIAQKDNRLSFVEVKTRSSDQKGEPYEAITYYKLKALYRCAQRFLTLNKYPNAKLSIDVVSIILGVNNEVQELKFMENVYP